jgi:hypothetical protein
MRNKIASAKSTKTNCVEDLPTSKKFFLPILPVPKIVDFLKSFLLSNTTLVNFLTLANLYLKPGYVFEKPSKRINTTTSLKANFSIFAIFMASNAAKINSNLVDTSMILEFVSISKTTPF